VLIAFSSPAFEIWVRWQSVTHGKILIVQIFRLEALVTNEFRTLQGQCSNLVPQGPGYENVSLENQVCATVGAVSGEEYVDGLRFAELAYGFSWSRVWMVRFLWIFV